MNVSEYVKRRNGVPLGDRNSLGNMLRHSLGAGTFSKFWHYWNPIWAYYMAKYVYKPLKFILPPALSVILTFVICGFIHDLAIMLVKWKTTLLLTPWFLFMGLFVVLGDYIKVDYSRLPWGVRALINLFIITSCLVMAYTLRDLIQTSTI